MKLQIKNGFAIVCAWCPDKKAVEEIASRQGFECSHGICETCAERELNGTRAAGVPAEIKERQATHDVTADSFATFDPGSAHKREHSQHAPSLSAAAASTPQVPAARVDDFVAVSIIAEVCGVDAYELINRYQPAHWGAPREFRIQGRHVLFNVACLPDLEDALGEEGLLHEAARLRAWWLARQASPAQQPAAALPWYRKGSFE